MIVAADLTFPHDYSVDVEAWLPPGPNTGRRYYYPGAGEQSGHDGVLLEVTPAFGDSWLGMFANQYRGGFSGVYSCPDNKSLCVIASGSGYIVRADDPLRWEEIPLLPVVEVRSLPEQNLLVFRDWTSLAAYGPNGLVWQTEHLALDGLSIENLDGSVLRGRASVGGATSDEYVHWVEYEVDLRTGRHTGGWQDV